MLRARGTSRSLRVRLFAGAPTTSFGRDPSALALSTEGNPEPWATSTGGLVVSASTISFRT